MDTTTGAGKVVACSCCMCQMSLHFRRKAYAITFGKRVCLTKQTSETQLVLHGDCQHACLLSLQHVNAGPAGSGMGHERAQEPGHDPRQG